jgi:hypothetical protein
VLGERTVIKWYELSEFDWSYSVNTFRNVEPYELARKFATNMNSVRALVQFPLHVIHSLKGVDLNAAASLNAIPSSPRAFSDGINQLVSSLVGKPRVRDHLDSHLDTDCEMFALESSDDPYLLGGFAATTWAALIMSIAASEALEADIDEFLKAMLHQRRIGGKQREEWKNTRILVKGEHQGYATLREIRNVFMHKGGILDRDGHRKLVALGHSHFEVGDDVSANTTEARWMIEDVIAYSFDLINTADRLVLREAKPSGRK